MFDKTPNRSDEIIPVVEAVEQKSEFPVVDFDNYVEICNFQNDGSRRRGILSSELYEEIVKDSSTGFIKSGNSRVPALIDVKYGLSMGYDAKKCHEYADDLSENVKVLALPFHELNDEEKNQVVEPLESNGKTALYFSDHDGDESTALKEVLDRKGINYKEKPLTNLRAAKGDEQAALSMYICSTKRKTPESKIPNISFVDVYNYYEKNLGPDFSSDGNTKVDLNIGSRLTDKQVSDMWSLFDDKFETLGDNHPMSMQDSVDYFLQMMKSDDTIIASAYSKKDDNYELECFVFFIDNIDSLFWLNSDFMKQHIDAQEDNLVIYTPGIVSSAVGASHASRVIRLFSKACQGDGANVDIFYENTNLSKKYIPRIVDRAIVGSYDDMEYKPSELIDKIDYRLWSIGSADE